MVYRSKINAVEEQAVKEFFKDYSLIPQLTPIKNYVIENNDKSKIWEMKKAMIAYCKAKKVNIEPKVEGIRDESYYDLIEEKRI